MPSIKSDNQFRTAIVRPSDNLFSLQLTALQECCFVISTQLLALQIQIPLELTALISTRKPLCVPLRYSDTHNRLYTHIYVEHRHILCIRTTATVLCHVICGDRKSHLSRWLCPRISPLTLLVLSVMQNVTV